MKKMVKILRFGHAIIIWLTRTARIFIYVANVVFFFYHWLYLHMPFDCALQFQSVALITELIVAGFYQRKLLVQDIEIEKTMPEIGKKWENRWMKKRMRYIEYLWLYLKWYGSIYFIRLSLFAIINICFPDMESCFVDGNIWLPMRNMIIFGITGCYPMARMIVQRHRKLRRKKFKKLMKKLMK